MLTRHMAAVGFRQGAAFGNAQQRIVCLIHFRLGEETLIGGHQRQAEPIRQCDQSRFDGTFNRQAMAMQFHPDAVGKGSHQPFQQSLGIGRLAFAEAAGNRPQRAAGQQKQPVRQVAQPSQHHLRLGAGIGFHKAGR